MDEWNKVFIPILGKEITEFSEELAVLLLCVDQSVKPCFMWDHSSVEPKSLLSLLQTLHSKRIISNPLAVVEVDQDIFIVNVDALARVLLGYLTSSHPWLIDISKTEPKVAAAPVHDTFKQYLWTILRQLGVAGDVMSQKDEHHANDPSNANNSMEHSNNANAATTSGSQNDQTRDNQIRSSLTNDNYGNGCSGTSDGISSNLQSLSSAAASDQMPRLIALSLPEEANLSTIFGCLLGYPQIYWWDGQSSGSSLSGMPLKVYKFTAQCSAMPFEVEEDTEEAAGVEVFSFSVPEVLETELRPAIQIWANIVHTRVEQAALFSTAKLNCDPVLCLDVGL